MKMKMTAKLFFSLAMSSLAFGLVLAGTLDPPGPPAPTMVTLQQIYDAANRPLDTCFADVGRFVNCGNGTVKDTVTELIWLRDASCLDLELLTWGDASIAVAQLGHGSCGLTDGSQPGDWRLPTLQCPSGSSCLLTAATGEFASLLAPSCPAPHILHTNGVGCWTQGNPFLNVQSYQYWSSTVTAAFPGNAWLLVTDAAGHVESSPKGINVPAWPVRGGK